MKRAPPHLKMRRLFAACAGVPANGTGGSWQDRAVLTPHRTKEKKKLEICSVPVIYFIL
jgi:hypothetical protein